MNCDDEGRDPADERDPLDGMLEAAAWPEPEPERVARLQQRWRELSLVERRARRSAWLPAAVAVAVGLLATITVWQLLSRPAAESKHPAPAPVGEPRASTQAVETPPATKGRSETPGEDDPPAVPAPEGRTAALSRAATPYEVLVSRAVAQRRRRSPELSQDGLLDRAISQRLADRTTDPDVISKPLMSDREFYERQLVEQIGQSAGPRRVAAIDLLGRVGSRNSVPLLVELSRDAETRTAAVQALTRLADSDTLGELVGEEADALLQEELCAALLARQGSRSLAVYLGLVRKPQTSDAALMGLDRVENPPVELLFEFLHGPRYADRTAAAVVLGRLDGAEVSDRLINMVRLNVNRQEALMALAASSGDEASRFVIAARQDPLLAGIVLAAQYRLRTLFP